MSLKNFFNYVMSDIYRHQEENKPKFKGNYSLDNFLSQKYKDDRFEIGLYSLYDSDSKGIMVPPGIPKKLLIPYIKRIIKGHFLMF